jgi:hypothetical protein
MSTILRRLFPRLAGILAMRKALTNYPFRPCTCEAAEACAWCDPSTSVTIISTAGTNPQSVM